MKKVVPSERLRRELDDVVGGISEEQDPIEAIARLGALLILQQALDSVARNAQTPDARGAHVGGDLRKLVDADGSSRR